MKLIYQFHAALHIHITVNGEIVYGLSALSSPPETEDTLLGNAMIKARSAFRETGLPVIADDSGFFVDEPERPYTISPFTESHDASCVIFLMSSREGPGGHRP